MSDTITHERIVEIDRTVDQLRRVIGTVENGGSDGSSEMNGLPSTMRFAHITIEMHETFCPSILNETYEYRAAANVVVPLIQKEIDELLEERERLAGGRGPGLAYRRKTQFGDVNYAALVAIAAAILFLMNL